MILIHLQREEWKTLRSQRKDKQDLLDLQLQVETEVQAKKNIQGKLTKATKDLTEMEKCVPLTVILSYRTTFLTYVVPSLCPLPWPCTATHPPVHTLCLTFPLFYCTRCTLYKHCLIISLPPLPPQEAPGSRHWEGTAAELSDSAAAGLATSQNGRYVYTLLHHQQLPSVKCQQEKQGQWSRSIWDFAMYIYIYTNI